ncbi:sigma-70 family RNA polymerase sigma factor [bacterium]|nr:sigma-70 family RNA polymerase sigma factor [bacterium]
MARKAKTPERERIQRERFAAAQQGDKFTRDALVEENIGLVHKWARRYYRYAQSIPTVTYDDIFLEGVYGLLKAIDKYKPQKGSFSTYATIWIKQSIRRFLQKEKAQLKGRGYLPTQEEDDEQMTLEDIQPEEAPAQPEVDLDNLEQKIKYADIPQRSKDILRMYFLEGLSLREIGEKIGLSKERVRQLIKEDGRKVLEE